MPSDNKFLVPLACFIEERGGATLITNDTIRRLWAKIEAAGDISIGMQPTPEGVLVMNLLGKEALEAWDAGGTPKEEPNGTPAPLDEGP